MEKLRQLFALLLLATFSTIAYAHDFEVDGIYYRIVAEWEEILPGVTCDNAVLVTCNNNQKNSYRGDVTIPEQVEYNGTTYDVVGIDDDAFCESSKMTSINLPGSIRVIKNSAFNSTSALTEIKLPDGLERLEGAFNASGIESIEFGNGLKYIGTQCFYASKLTGDVELPGSIEELGYGVFQHTKVQHVTIGCGLKQIDREAFCYMDHLSYIVNYSDIDIANKCNVTCNVYNSIAQHGDFWFAQDPDGYLLCRYSGSSKTLTLPGNYEGNTYRIGYRAFKGCTFTSVSIGDGVTEIGEEAFADCYYIASLNLGSTLKKIGKSAFQSANTSLNKLVVPNSVETIDERAFYACNRLAEITLGSGVKVIGDRAFSECNDLAKIVLPNSVKTLGGDFVAYTSIQEITLGTGLEEIDIFAFRDVWSDPVIYNYSSVNIEEECRYKESIVVYSNLRSINGFEFATVSGENYLIKYTGSDKEIVLPDAVGDNAYSIGKSAFQGTGIKSVTFGRRITGIGANAFQGCDRLLSVTLNDGLSGIGNNAFRDCESLEEVTFGSQLESIGDNAFIYCRNIKKLQLPNSLISIGAYAFHDLDKLETLSFGDKLEYIGASAFNNCDNLAEVAIPASVKTIYEGAFESCHNLKSLQLNEGLATIGDRAFNCAGCNNRGLTELTIPNSVEKIGESIISNTPVRIVYLGTGLAEIHHRAFNGAEHLQYIINKSDIDIAEECNVACPIYTNCQNIGDYTFASSDGKCEMIAYSGDDESLVLPDDIDGTPYSIGAGVFRGKSMASVALGSHVTEIGDDAFRDCGNLQTLLVPNSVTAIGGSFIANSGVRALTLGSGLTNVDQNIFSEANNLQYIYNYSSLDIASLTDRTVYNTPTTIGDFEFARLNGKEYLIKYTGTDTEELILPDDVDGEGYHIGAYVFQNNRKLKSVTLGAKVISVGESAFEGCSKITSLTLNEGLDSTGYRAFYGLKAVETLEIPGSVKTIYIESFSHLENLRTLTLNEGLKVIGPYAFCNCYSLQSVVIPNTAKRIEESAFAECHSLSTVTLGNSVEHIGYRTFAWCSLTTLTIPNSVKNIEGHFICYTGISTIVLGNGLTTLADDTFDEAGSLRKVFNNSSIDIAQYVGNECTVYSDFTIVDDYLFVKEGEQNELTHYMGNETDLVLPESVNGEKYVLADKLFQNSPITSLNTGNGVTALGENTIQSCKQLKSVVLGDAVESLGNCSLNDCNSLTEITIGKALKRREGGVLDGANLTTINYNAVDYRGYLDGHWITTLNFGSEVRYIPAAFNNNPNLTSITLPESVDTIADYAFCNCEKLEAIAISNGAKHIGHRAFADNPSLTSITLPESVETIQSEAFCNCEKLEAITIPNKVKHLGYRTFAGNKSLKEVTIGKGLESGEGGIFDDCNAIAVVNFNAVNFRDEIMLSPQVTINLGNEVERIPRYMFRDRNDITELNLPESVKHIGHQAFYGCTNLTAIVIPDNVEVIDNEAFGGIPVKRLTLNAVLDTIGGNAFNCHELTELVIPDGVRYIGDNAFYSEWNRRSLEFLTLGQSVEHIGNWAFCYNKIKELVIPDNVKTIGNYAFAQSNDLKALTLSNSLKVISAETFSGCNNLQELVVPNSVTEIQDRAFSDCGNLQKVVFGDNLRTIGNEAFNYCGWLREAILPSSVRTIGDRAFRGIWNMNNIKLNEGLVSIGKEAFWDTNCGEIIIIPSTVKEIGTNAFDKVTYCLTKSTPPRPWATSPSATKTCR